MYRVFLLKLHNSQYSNPGAGRPSSNHFNVKGAFKNGLQDGSGFQTDGGVYRLDAGDATAFTHPVRGAGLICASMHGISH
jgi:hypothetical protein